MSAVDRSSCLLLHGAVVLKTTTAIIHVGSRASFRMRFYWTMTNLNSVFSLISKTIEIGFGTADKLPVIKDCPELFEMSSHPGHTE